MSADKSEIAEWFGARDQPPTTLSGEASSVEPGRAWRTAAFVTMVIVTAMVFGGAMWRSRSGAPAPAPLLPRPLASSIEPELSPSLAPDGSRVVYARRQKNRTALFVKPVAGGSAQPLAISGETAFSSAGYPAWSPRGDLIAFLGQEAADSFGLYVVAASGGVARRLTVISGVGICWSPNGETIAFADRATAAEPLSIFSIPIDSGPRRRLTTPPPASFGDTFCAFSPDSRKLAVVRHATRYEGNVHVVPLDRADNSLSEQVSHSLNSMMGIAWSPDGAWIVAGAAHGLWRIPATGGGEPVAIAGKEGGAAYPAFSQGANGLPTRLVYQSHYRDVNIWQWTAGANADGSTRRITDSTWWEDEPSLSPDGSLAYSSNQTGATQLWMVDGKESNHRQLTFGPAYLVLSPKWSPNGRHIAFSATVAANRDIYTIGADGKGVTRLTREPADDGNPTWSRDGRWIYFRSDRAGLAQIWKMPAAGGQAVRVSDGEASQAVESYDGKQLYFVRNVPDAGLWSMPVAGGRETFLIRGVKEGYWDVTERGIMYIPSEAGLPDGTFEIRFFDVASRSSSLVADLRAPLMPLSPGFAVSRDGRSIYWTQVDDDRDDVMLIDPWMP